MHQRLQIPVQIVRGEIERPEVKYANSLDPDHCLERPRRCASFVNKYSSNVSLSVTLWMCPFQTDWMLRGH